MALTWFFVIDDEIITPMLTGSILPGITRDSVISLAKMWNLKVEERKISIDELIDAHESGKLQEIFGSGTAAVISPVGEIRCGEKVLTINDGKVGPMANRFYNAITDIQHGRAEDPFGWIEQIC
jgi:branched-chain amino acid aminotransferase